MFTGIYATLAKYALIALAIAGACVGIWYGIDTVAGAFRDRTALQAKVEQDARDLTATQAEAKRKQTELQANVATLQTDIDARDKSARAAAERQTTIDEELQHAKSQLAAWKRTASPALRSCLDMPAPDGDGVQAPDGSGGVPGRAGAARQADATGGKHG